MNERFATRAWLAGCLLLGALLRLAYLAEIRASPDFAHPAVDAGFHDYWARALVSGDWSPPPGAADPEIRTTPYFRPPGYPYFLALVYRLSGGSHLAPRLAQMLLGLVSCCLAFLLAREWLGRRPAIFAAAVMAVYWPFIFFEGELLEPALLIPASLGMVLLLGAWLRSGRIAPAFWAGVAAGVHALIRPNILLFLALAPLWFWWASRGRPRAGRRLKPALALLAGAALAIAPATIRNWVAAEDLVLISTNGGVNLYLGNFEGADGRIKGSIPGLGTFLTCFDYPPIIKGVERIVGRPLKHSEVSAYFSRRAWDHAREHPARTLALMARKAFLFWGPHEVGHNKEEEVERLHSGILRHLPGGFWVLLGLAASGAVLVFLGLRRPAGGAPRWWPEAADPERLRLAALIVLFTAAIFLSYLPFTVAGRYRMTVVPFVILLAGFSLDAFAAAVAARRHVFSAAWLASSGLLVLLASRNPAGYEPDHARWHFDRGLAFAGEGAVGKAADEFREAVRIDPQYPEARASLGYALLLAGDGAGAEAEWRRAIAINPAYPAAHAYLGKHLVAGGRFSEGLAELRQALALEPDSWSRHYDLATALLRAGQVSESIRRYRAALSLNRGFAGLAEVVSFLDDSEPGASAAAREMDRSGLAAAARGEYDTAVRALRESVRLAPNHAPARSHLAVVLALAGDQAGADEEVRAIRRRGRRPPTGAAYSFLASLAKDEP